MPLFKHKGESLQLIKETKIQLEKDLQSTTEKNLEAVFGLNYLVVIYDKMKLYLLIYNYDL